MFINKLKNIKWVNKFLIILVSLIVGILIGALITTTMYNNKFVSIKDKHYKIQQKLYKELEVANERLSNMESNLKVLSKENETLRSKLEATNKELTKFKERKELYDKYEYILFDNSERTDVTYNQVAFAEHEMEKRGVNPHLLFGIVQLESRGKEKAQSSISTATGYCQFLKGTGKWVYEQRLSRGSYHHSMALNGKLNLEMGAEYVSYLVRKYNGNVKKALIAYNGGELGERYYNIIDSRLRQHGTSLSIIENQYVSNKKM